MHRRHFLAASMALPVWPALAARPLTLGCPMAPQFGAAYIARDKGFFGKRGLDLTIQLIALTSTVPAALMSESVQIGGMGTTVFLQAVDSGLDLVALAAGSLQDAALNEVQVVASAKSGIRSPADLVGRKLGLPGLNGALHVMTVSWLKKNRVDPSRVTLVEVPFAQMRTVLQGGSVDGVVSIEPFVSGMVKDGVGSVLPGLSQTLRDGTATTVWAAARGWAEAQAPLVKVFRQSLADAVEFARHDEAGARTAIGQYFKAPPAVIQAMPFPVLQSEIHGASLQHWVELMLDQHMLKREPRLPSLVAS